MSSPSSATSSDRSPDQLAKAWVLGVVDRTPLDRLGELDVELLASEAPLLIADVLDRLARRSPGELPEAARRRAGALAELRHGTGAGAEVSRDLAVLHSVLIEALARDAPVGGQHSDLERTAQRLAETFGSLNAAVVGRQLGEPGRIPAQEHVALPGSADLERWLGVLLAQHRRYGSPFAVALLELDGLGRIFEAHGRRPGELMLAAATTVIRNQIRVVDHAFRVDEDAFCVLAPNVDAGRLRRMADRLARVVEASQAADGPRIAISAGVSGCPEHGHDSGRLLEIAEDALGAAKAAGEPVQVATANGAHSGPPA